ncbi:ABC transporter permease [Rhodococcus ruber]|uniref:ABC transporter permease n=1 Tax=Rhodococcus ruber TaxID=1830 RepID=A0ABT4MEU2_9NOCA|nr:ABC transporter permease [Rhodococcus ruber]MCZ4519497.1 ABC transporter permease [Rhodococcus ruber]
MRRLRGPRATWLLHSAIRDRSSRKTGLLLCVVLSAAALSLTTVVGSSVSYGIARGIEAQYLNTDIIVRTEAASATVQNAGANVEPGISASERDEIGNLREVQAVGGSVRARAALRIDGRTESIDLESAPTAEEMVWQRISEGRAPMAGAELALTGTAMRSLHLSIGDVVAMSRPGGATTTMRIVGVVDVGASVDHNAIPYGIVTLDTARAFAGVTGFTDLRIELMDTPTEIVQVLSAIGAITPQAWPQTTQILVSSAKEVYGSEVAALRATTAVLAIVVAVISIVVISTVVMASVPARRRRAEMLRIIGATRGQVRAAILAETTSIGVVGGAVGLVVGVVLAIAVVPMIGYIPGAPGFGLSDVRIDWTLLALVPIGYAVVGFLGGACPSWVCTRGTPSVGDSKMRVGNIWAVRFRRGMLPVLIAFLWAVALASTILWTTPPWTTLLVHALLIAAVVGSTPAFYSQLGKATSWAAGRARWPLIEIAGGRMHRNPLVASNFGLPVICATALLMMVWVAFSSLDQTFTRPDTSEIVADAMVAATAADGTVDQQTVDKLVGLPAVAASVAIRTIDKAELSGDEATAATTVLQNIDVAAVPELNTVTNGRFSIGWARPDTIYLAASSHPAFADGQYIELTPPGGSTRSIRVQYVDGLPFEAFLTPEAAGPSADNAAISGLWLHIHDDVDPADAISLIDATALLGGDYQVRGTLGDSARLVLLTHLARDLALAVCGLGLGLALTGVTLTGAATVRTRLDEVVLLRVVGAEGSSVRHMVIAESLLVTLAAAVGGSVLGMIAASAAVEALDSGTGLGSTATVPIAFAAVTWVAALGVARLSMVGVTDLLSGIRPASAFHRTLLK